MNKARNKKIDIVILEYSVSDDINKNLTDLMKNISDIKVAKNTTIVVSHELSYLKYFPITKNIGNKKNAINMSSKIIKNILDLCLKKIFSFYFHSLKKIRINFIIHQYSYLPMELF